MKNTKLKIDSLKVAERCSRMCSYVTRGAKTKTLKFQVLRFVGLSSFLLVLALCLISCDQEKQYDNSCTNDDRFNVNRTISNLLMDTTKGKTYYDSLLLDKKDCLSIYSCAGLIRRKFLEVENSGSCKCLSIRLSEEQRTGLGFDNSYACCKTDRHEDFFLVRDSIRYLFSEDQAVRKDRKNYSKVRITKVDSISYSFIKRKINIAYLNKNNLSNDDAQKLSILYLHNTMYSTDKDVMVYKHLIEGLEVGLFSFQEVKILVLRHLFVAGNRDDFLGDANDIDFSGLEHVEPYINKILAIKESTGGH